MCTAATYLTEHFYFGRTLDYEVSYHEEVVVTPRNYPFRFRKAGTQSRHYAMIGMACVMDGYPLYYDAVNEKGLGMAGLNFVGNAHYGSCLPGKDNIAQFELIPWVLGQCDSVKQARELLGNLRLIDLPFSDGLSPAQLHWILGDRREVITVEVTWEGLRIYDNPVGVLTNNPPFPQQMQRLRDFMGLSPREPQNRFSDALDLTPYSRGMGALGLPGDLSSQSRFVRVAFVRMNSRSGGTVPESVNQFFHILGSVEQQRGCCELASGDYEVTLYTGCCDADTGIYYYTTYGNHQICAVDMHRENLDGQALCRHALISGEQIRLQN